MVKYISEFSKQLFLWVKILVNNLQRLILAHVTKQNTSGANLKFAFTSLNKYLNIQI